MTMDELAASLPNGFHDARLSTLSVDYSNREAVLNLDIWVGNLRAKADDDRETYRQAQISLSGLLFWVSEPPDAAYPYQHDGPLMIDVGAMQDFAKPASITLPPIPNDAFANWIFVRDWNAFIFLAAKGARLAWRTT